MLDTSWHAGRPECTACKGVAWWAERTGQTPQILFTSQLVAELEQKEALRRRMSGVEKPLAPGPLERRRRRAASLRKTS